MYLTIRFIPESPRWLLAMGKVDETMEILQKASKINKHPLPVNMDKILNQVNGNKIKTRCLNIWS